MDKLSLKKKLSFRVLFITLNKNLRNQQIFELNCKNYQEIKGKNSIKRRKSAQVLVRAVLRFLINLQLENTANRKSATCKFNGNFPYI